MIYDICLCLCLYMACYTYVTLYTIYTITCMTFFTICMHIPQFRGLDYIDEEDLDDDDEYEEGEDSRVITTTEIEESILSDLIDDVALLESPVLSAITGKKPGTPLTPAELEAMKQQVDTMSDEELKALFGKLKDSLGQDLANTLANPTTAIPGFDLFSTGTTSTSTTTATTTGKEKKVLPRAPVVDKEVRAKYQTELELFEAELEKLYENPLAVWQDMIMNPDKLKDPIEGGGEGKK